MKQLCLGHCDLLCCFLGLVKQEETLKTLSKRGGRRSVSQCGLSYLGCRRVGSGVTAGPRQRRARPARASH